MREASGSCPAIPRRSFLQGSILGAIAVAGGPVPARDARLKFERRIFAHLPTPLEKLEVLAAELGHPKLIIKRDDQTGLALGGNKTRKLEYIIADALNKKADTIVTSAGVQSNWCRQTAAAARKFGLRPVLVLAKRDDAPVAHDGNLLLDFLFDAEVRIIEPGADRAAVVDEIEAGLRKKGRNPYVAPVGGSMPGGSMREPLGAVAYVQAFLELHEQAGRDGTAVDAVVLATGSGGTQAGLVVGAKMLNAPTRIVGISVSGSKGAVQKTVAAISDATAAALGLKTSFAPEEIIVFDDYVGEGYGKMTPAAAGAIRLLAVKEGILLDPVYTSKAMAGMIDLVKKGYFQKNETVAFLHTGGAPALFVYRDELISRLR